jgi:hypothetical protein
MTILAANSLDDATADLVETVADTLTPLGILHMADFKAACWIDAITNEGDVHPSRVSALLHDLHGDVHPQRLSAMWAPACGPDGFLDKADEWVAIDPTHSRGNGNKVTRLRRWRGWSES